MQEIAEAIRDHAAEIIQRCQEERMGAAGTSHASAERIDHLVDVVTTLAFASLAESMNREFQEKALDSAARHGKARREQGFEVEVVLEEYYFVRRALWAFIREHADPEIAVVAIGRIDQAASLTSRASLLGYFRTELESEGKWPEAVEKLIHLPPFQAEPE